VRLAVEQQVATGDAEVEVAGADVDRDVARTQEEELDVVLGVGEDELTMVRALPVTGLAEHHARWLRERTLVRYRDAQHGSSVDGVGGGQRCAYTSCSFRPRASMRTCRW
jgi:hypothetical protein